MGTSKLQNYLSSKLCPYFMGHVVYENTRPDWLRSYRGNKIELDFYIPDLQIAIEVQGLQHFQYVCYFHGSYNNFLDQKRRDQDKKDLCYGRKIKLIEVCDYHDADAFISKYNPKHIKCFEKDSTLDYISANTKVALMSLRTRLTSYLKYYNNLENFRWPDNDTRIPIKVYSLIKTSLGNTSQENEIIALFKIIFFNWKQVI